MLSPGPFAFILLPAVLVGLLAWGTAVAWRRSGAGIAAARRAGIFSAIAGSVWMAVTWMVAASGILRDWSRTPPPFLFLVVAIVALALTVAYSRLGARLATTIPLWVLVLVQAFRLPLELDTC